MIALLSEKQLRTLAEQYRKSIEKELVRFFSSPALKLKEVKLEYRPGYNWNTSKTDQGLPGTLSGSFATSQITNQFGVLSHDLKEAKLRVDITIRENLGSRGTPSHRWEAWGRIELLMLPKSARTNRIEPIGHWVATPPKGPITYTSFMSKKRKKPEGKHLISE